MRRKSSSEAAFRKGRSASTSPLCSGTGSASCPLGLRKCTGESVMRLHPCAVTFTTVPESSMRSK